MIEELQQPATARARDCQAVRWAGACAGGGTDPPGNVDGCSFRTRRRRRCRRRHACEQRGQAGGVGAARAHVPSTACSTARELAVFARCSGFEWGFEYLSPLRQLNVDMKDIACCASRRERSAWPAAAGPRPRVRAVERVRHAMHIRGLRCTRILGSELTCVCLKTCDKKFVTPQMQEAFAY